MRTFSFLVAAALLGPSLAAAQQINWIVSPDQAIKQAKNTGKPLMVYVRQSSSERAEDDDVDRDHQRAFRDARVLRAASRFVPLRLSSSRDRGVLAQFGLSASASMEMSFVTPDGEVLGPTLSAGGIGQPDSLIQRLNQAMRQYGQKIYRKEIQPILQNEASPAADLRTALGRVADIDIDEADTDIVAVLKREKLEAPVRIAAYDALAALSTKTSMQTLFEHSSEGKADATKALTKATPEGAEYLLDAFKSKEGTFNYDAYQAVLKICRIKDGKPKAFFENSSADFYEKELERVRKLVREAAERWRSQNA